MDVVHVWTCIRSARRLSYSQIVGTRNCGEGFWTSLSCYWFGLAQWPISLMWVGFVAYVHVKGFLSDGDWDGSIWPGCWTSQMWIFCSRGWLIWVIVACFRSNSLWQKKKNVFWPVMLFPWSLWFDLRKITFFLSSSDAGFLVDIYFLQSL